MHPIKSFFLFFFFCIVSLYAKEYKSIQFKSLIHLSRLSALEISGLESKKDINEKDIDYAIIQLFKQGYFKDIKVFDINNSLVFKFKEKPTISDIHYKGINDTEVEDKIKPIIDIKKGDLFSTDKLDKVKKKIIKIYRAEGFFDTIVEYDIKHEDDSVDVTFDIKKGANIIITKQEFEGIKKFSPDDVEHDLANKEEDTVGWWFGQSDGKLRLDELEFDYQRLKNFYMKHGYLDVEITKPLLSVDFDQYAANIHYAIKEGIQYRVGDIKIRVVESNITIKDSIKEEFKLKKDHIFNIEKMRKDIATLKDIVGSKGYAYARIFPDIKKDKKKKIADVVYVVQPGEKVYIKDVRISGNTKTLDRVIRREVSLAPKDLYSSTEIKESKKALKRLGFFKSVEIKEIRESKTSMTLLIKVEETHTASLMAGGGYGSLNGWMINASISDRNVFGGGMGLSFSLEKTERTGRVEFSIKNPRVNDSPYSLGTSFYIKKSDYTSYSTLNNYKSEAKGVSLSVGKRLNRYWHASTSINYSYSDVTYENEDNLSQYTISGTTRKISLIPYISFNDTDDFFVPRSGKTFSDSIAFVGFGGDQKYISENMRFSYHYGLEDIIDMDFILRYRARGSYILADTDDYIAFPLTSRLRLGGIGTVRGFRSSSISPIKYDKNNDLVRIGGNQMISNSFEFNFPIAPSTNLRGSLFYDWGSIGVDKFSETRSSYGINFEWNTPMAPLMFVFAWPMNTKDYDRVSEFEFSIGQRF